MWSPMGANQQEGESAMTWLGKPLGVWDLETTSADPETARVVTGCVGWCAAPGEWEPREWLAAAPDIPAEAVALHGITTENAAAHGEDPRKVLAEIRDELYRIWSVGAPVCGFNLVYDTTVLDRDLRRNDLGPLEIEGPMIDGYVIDKAMDAYRKGKRTLESMCQHYRVPFDGAAHNATADTFATLRLIWRLAMDWNLGDMDLIELHQKQVGWRREQQESLAAYFRKTGKDATGVNTAWPIIPKPHLVSM